MASDPHRIMLPIHTRRPITEAGGELAQVSAIAIAMTIRNSGSAGTVRLSRRDRVRRRLRAPGGGPDSDQIVCDSALTGKAHPATATPNARAREKRSGARSEPLK